MNTTQRSESMNAFFDYFVDSTTTLQEFVMRYEKTVDSRYSKEKKENFESRYKSRILKLGSKMEHHGASVYTKNIFNIFQHELIKNSQFTRQKVKKTGSCYEYKVSSCFDTRDNFLVHLDLDSRAGNCSCCLFEFQGILCRHLLAIFHFKDIVEIPSQYILRRWTKEANKGCEIYKNGPSHEVDDEKSAALRSLHVCRLVNRLSHFAEKSEKIYKVIVGDLDQIYQKVSMMEAQAIGIIEKDCGSSQQLMSEVLSEAVESQSHYISLTTNIGDPHISQTKGRRNGSQKSQSGRFKSSLEIALTHTTVKRWSCQICGGYGHNKRSCKGMQNSTNMLSHNVE
ncbi:hypothetical protein HRI_003280600 [Hibiscus trionum]|uniref:Protein FAR1-RELATED SEQUENCE n=1 Tax=Hibiscus trionum TaxID=183268 RepID=A0A9W7IL48_HIBTR|nr:hypothetical protein HRI_003280600 [Hibiscus trionum]